MDSKQYDIDIGKADVVNFNNLPTKRPGVPACPLPNAARIFGRSAVIDDLAARLTAESAGALAISAVRGLPGVGKTDLLRAVGCDSRITKHFTGGVLYAELGQTPDAAQILRRWLTEMDQNIPQTDDAATLAAVVRGQLADRPALLLIDDVWESSMRAAQTLRGCATPACGILASSRSPEIAAALAASQRHTLNLPALDADPALALLREHAPDVVAADEAGAAALAKALGYLPLALKLAGRLLENDDSDRPCAALLANWRQRLDEMKGYGESRPGVETAQISLDAILDLSYAALPDEATRGAAAALAVFGATPLDWARPAMEAVWEIDTATANGWIESLTTSGLVERDAPSKRYSLHQTVQAFLAHRCADEPMYAQRQATYYAALMEQCDLEAKHESTIDAALATLDREIEQIERGQAWVANAALSDWRDGLLIDYAFACADYFDLRGRYSQKIEWAEAGRAAARQQGRQRDEAAMLEMQGIAYQPTGRYIEAITAYSQAQAVYQSLKAEADSGRLLGNLGIVYERQGRYDEATAHYQQSLEIKQRISDTAGMAATLNNLGIVYQAQGRYDEAIAHHQQSLEITERIGDTAGTATTLGNLGIVYKSQGRYDEAIAHYQQSLEITERIGDLATTARQLSNLGVVYQLQGRYDEAIAHYQQSLEIKERIGDVNGAALTSWNLGTLYEAQGDLAAALPLMERCVLWEEQIGHPDATADRAQVEGMRARLGGLSSE